MQMKTTIIALTGIVIAATAIASCMKSNSEPIEKQQESTENKTSQIKRGAYLITIGGCNDCHSPKVMTPNGPAADPQKLLSGHLQEEKVPAFDVKGVSKEILQTNMNLTAWQGPWGISFTANLTPDKETGIGNWTVEQFKRALREGKSKGLPAARPMLPPMPWFNYAHMTDEDLEAMFAYLQSLPAVHNQVPAAIAPAAAN